MTRVADVMTLPGNLSGGGITKLPPKDPNELPVDHGTEDPNTQ
jgi:hypothetical protein